MPVPEVDDHHCHSIFEQNKLTLRIRAKLHHFRTYGFRRHDCNERRQPRIQITYRNSMPSDELLQRYRDTFARSVRDKWDAKLVLVDYGSVARVPTVSCSVEVIFSDAEEPKPHLRINGMFDPVLTTWDKSANNNIEDFENFRSECWRGGADNYGDNTVNSFDMHLAWLTSRSGWTVEREWELRQAPGAQRFRLAQDLAAHEFGHYLGLDHPCAGPSSSTGGFCNPEDYCERSDRTLDDMEDIMALGNRVHGGHATPWIERLVAYHHFHCGAVWRGARL